MDVGEIMGGRRKKKTRDNLDYQVNPLITGYPYSYDERFFALHFTTLLQKVKQTATMIKSHKP